MTRTTIGSGLLVAAIAGSASADSFNLTYLGTNAGISGQYWMYNGGGTQIYSGNPGNGGQFSFQKNGQGNHKAFCTQLSDGGFGNPYTTIAVEAGPESDSSAPPNDPFGTYKGKVVRALMAKNWQVFGAMDTEAKRDHARTFQLAVWEVVYTGMDSSIDTNAEILNWMAGLVGNTNAGNDITFAAGSSTILSGGSSTYYDLLASMLGNITSADLDAGGAGYIWSSEAGQDVLVVPVPAPALLAGLGLVGAVAVRRRLKKA